LAVLESTHVNTSLEALSYRLSSQQHDALRDLLRFYSPTSGPIRKVATYLGPGGGFRVNVGHSSYFDLDRVFQLATGLPSLDTGSTKSLFGGGKGFSLFDMFVSTLGEGVERVLGSLAFLMGRADPTFGTWRELTEAGLRCLAPAEVPLFAEAQYAQPGFMYEPYREDTWLAWIQGKRLLSGEPIWVPAQLVNMVHLLHPAEGFIGYAASGGLSCHVSREEALLHGITELMERDAVNLRWYLSIAPEEIVLDRPSHDPRLQALIDDLGGMPGERHWLHHSIDIPEVPVVTVIEIAPWMRRFAYNAGGGVDIDVDGAMLGALTEFGQSERTIRMSAMTPDRAVSESVYRMFDIADDACADDLTLYVQAIGFYGHRSNRDKLDWYLHGNPKLGMSELPSGPSGDQARFAHLLAILRRHDLDPIVFDFSPQDTDCLRLVKVFMPELTQPFLQSQPMFGHPRFRAIAEQRDRLGPDGEVELRADPLPYP
jgi:ribosomal protein S12 methylthiotransferase accessory factor